MATNKGRRITGRDLQRFAAQSSLDAVVHDLKSKEATDINNRGVAAQLKFLRETCGMTDKQVLDAAYAAE